MEYTNNIIHEEHKQEFFVANGVRNDSFIKESNGKIGVLSFLFSIFYPIGYFYKQWKAIKKNNEEYKNISPFWRGLFYPFYAFSFAKILKKLLEAKKEQDLKQANTEEEKIKIEKQNKNNALLCIALPLGLLGIVLSTLAKFLIGQTDWPINALIVFLMLYLFQNTTRKILPTNHPQGKLTFADFLGVFPWIFALLLSLIFYLSTLTSRIQLDGNNIVNTLHNYSFTFPFENQEVYLDEDNHYCQNKADNPEDGLICMQWELLTGPFEETFFENLISQEEEITLIKKWTKIYQGNTAYCFLLKGEEVFNTCYLKTTREKRLWVWEIASLEEDPIAIEKLMNSYKSW